MEFLKRHIECYKENHLFSDAEPYLRRIVQLAGTYSLFLKRDLQYKTPIKEQEDKHCAVKSVLLPADIMLERFIINQLSHNFPDTPIVSEEGLTGNLVKLTPDDNTFFCIDPLDGSYCFANNEQDFSIQLGLIVKGEPVLGISHYPLKNKTYIGYHGIRSKIVENGREYDFPVYERNDLPESDLKAYISNASADREHIKKYLNSLGIAKSEIFRGCPNLCSTAEGKCDLFPIFHSHFEWDTAAYDAILRYTNDDAHRCLITLDGTNLHYGKNNTVTPFKNPPMVVTLNKKLQNKIKFNAYMANHQQYSQGL